MSLQGSITAILKANVRTLWPYNIIPSTKLMQLCSTLKLVNYGFNFRKFMDHKVTYASINKTVSNEDEFSSLLDLSIANKIPHLHECGGHGRCTSCRVRIIEGLNNLIIFAYAAVN